MNTKKVAVMMRIIVETMRMILKMMKQLQRRKSKYPPYDPTITCPTLCVAIKSNNAKHFKESIVKYSIAQ